MAEINQLNTLDQISSDDLLPIFSRINSDARKVSAYNFAQYVLDQMTEQLKVRQYSAPAATGFNVQVTDQSSDVWLTLMPAAGYAAGTIVLPALANSADQQEVIVNCTQSVTTLTVNGNGATVVGAPTTLSANAYFKLKYDAVMATWYRIG